MPKFEGKVSYTLDVTVRVVISDPIDSESEEFDEDALVQEISDTIDGLSDTISDLVQKNLSLIKKGHPCIQEIEIEDHLDTDVDEWSQIEE